MPSKNVSKEKLIWNKKDLLGLEYLSREEIELILDTAVSFKEISIRPCEKSPYIERQNNSKFFL